MGNKLGTTSGRLESRVTVFDVTAEHPSEVRFIPWSAPEPGMHATMEAWAKVGLKHPMTDIERATLRLRESNDRLEASLKRDSSPRLQAARARIAEKIAKRQEKDNAYQAWLQTADGIAWKKRIPKPRYDDVFYEGLDWLNKQ